MIIDPRKSLGLLVPAVVVITILSFLVNEICDLDIWWHLSIGRDIMANLSIPAIDKFTVAGFGQHYHDSHWLFQLLSAWADGLFGLYGVQACMIMCWMTTFFFVWKSARSYTDDGTVAILVFLMALTSVERFLPRPEIISFLAIAIFCYMLQTGKYVSIAHLSVFFFLQVVWANSHGLFVIGPFLVTCYFLRDVFYKFSGREHESGKTALLLIFVLAATFVVPWGADGWKYSLLIFSETSAGSPGLFRSIGELSPVLAKQADQALRSGSFASWWSPRSQLWSFRSLKENSTWQRH